MADTECCAKLALMPQSDPSMPLLATKVNVCCLAGLRTYSCANHKRSRAVTSCMLVQARLATQVSRLTKVSSMI